MVIWLILRLQIWSLKYEWERNCYLSILFCGIWGILTENQLLTVTHLSRFTLFETITINHSYWSFQLEFLSKNSFTLSEFHFERNRHRVFNSSNLAWSKMHQTKFIRFLILSICRSTVESSVQTILSLSLGPHLIALRSTF